MGYRTLTNNHFEVPLELIQNHFELTLKKNPSNKNAAWDLSLH
jgi:hypothetical protein